MKGGKGTANSQMDVFETDSVLTLSLTSQAEDPSLGRKTFFLHCLYFRENTYTDTQFPVLCVKAMMFEFADDRTFGLLIKILHFLRCRELR